MNRHRLELPEGLQKPLKKYKINLFPQKYFFLGLLNLHLQNKDEFITRFINSMQLHNLLGTTAKHEHCNFMLNLLNPTSRPTTTSQEFRCIFYARFFVRRSTNRAKISSV